MNEFDKTYEEEMRSLTEGAFKSLATAGLLGLGALGADNAVADYNKAPVVQPRMSDSELINKTLPFTKWAEGYRDLVYDDKGNPAIGYGANLNSLHISREFEKLGYSIHQLKNRNQRISEKHAEMVLKRGLEQALRDAKQFVYNFDELDPIAKLVLVDMSYNLGLDRISKFKKFKSALERRDYKSAKAEMIDSKWYSDVGRRSRRLVQLMDTVADRM